VKVICHVRDLFEEPFGRVRHDSPGVSPARSIVNSCLHDGQATNAWL
jgi:hypothetical protein